MYNNIVIYIVGHSQDDSMSPNEMHIFQCVNVSARDVVEDLKAFKQGRYRYCSLLPLALFSRYSYLSPVAKYQKLIFIINRNNFS